MRPGAASADHIMCYLAWKDEIDSHELNDWEIEFLEDISIRLEAGKGLTEKQQAKLNDIWERVIG